jgi:hypothetical protein
MYFDLSVNIRELLNQIKRYYTILHSSEETPARALATVLHFIIFPTKAR